MDEHTVPLRIAEIRLAFSSKQFYCVEPCELRSCVSKDIIIVFKISILIADGFKSIDKFGLDFIF